MLAPHALPLALRNRDHSNLLISFLGKPQNWWERRDRGEGGREGEEKRQGWKQAQRHTSFQFREVPGKEIQGFGVRGRISELQWGLNTGPVSRHSKEDSAGWRDKVCTVCSSCFLVPESFT